MAKPTLGEVHVVQHTNPPPPDRTEDPPAGGYATGAVHFDGATFIDRALPLPGGSASSVYLFSAWFKNPVEQAGNTAHSMCFLCLSPNINVEITGVFNAPPFGGFFATGNQNATPSGGTASGVVFPPDQTGWHHFAASMDFSAGDPNNIYQLYLDGVALDVLMTYGPTGVPFAYPWNSTDDDTNLIFLQDASSGGDVPTAVDIADLYFNPYERLDLSVPANLAKLISGGKPADLGADGSAVTGTAPAFFFRRAPSAAAATFATNLGTAGNGTLTGTLTAAASSPTD